MNIRPSSLPKLAECRCYRSKPSTSGAAARGTTVDSIIRAAWQAYTAGRFHESNPSCNTLVSGQPLKPAKPEDALPYGLEPAERTACAWALDKLLQYSNGAEVFTAEDDCRAASYTDGIEDGTMDAVIPSEQVLLDFKTGQIRSYYHQMAAYALSCMNTYFADEWTAVLLFVDQQEVTVHEFTKESALAAIQPILEAPLLPSSCEYCSWCANFTECPCTRLAMVVAQQAAGPEEAQKELLAALKKDPASVPAVQALMGDPEKAAQFDEMLKIASKVSDAVRTNIKDQLETKHTNKIGRWTISTITPKDKQVVPPDVVGHYIGEIGFDAVLNGYGAMSADVFNALWAKRFPNTPPPTGKYVTVPGGKPYSKLTISKK